MIKRGAILLLLLALWTTTVRAYDFAATVPSGQTLYFSLVTGGVQVVYPNANNTPTAGWNGFTRPTGALTVPATVSDGNNTYNVLSIGNHALYGCTGLTSVTLAEGIAAVGNSAMRQCSALTTITLPSTLSSIGDFAFVDDSALTDVWAGRPTPPTTGNNIFYNIALSACTLHVACNAVAAYSAVAPWSGFGTLVDAGCMVTVAVQANYAARGTVSGGGSYNAGTLVTLAAQPTAGCFFACWQDGDTLNPRIVNALSDCSFTAMFFHERRDTLWLGDGDTLVLHDTVVHSDTVYLTLQVHDTVNLYDTIHDTILPTFYRLDVTSGNTALGVGVGSALLPAGTLAEVCGLPLEGGRFVCWSDGSADNPRQLTLTSNTTLQAVFEQLSLSAAEGGSWHVSVSGMYVAISGIAGQQVRVYDVAGRLLYSTMSPRDTLSVRVPVAGAYLVRVGEGPARKVMVN